MMLLRIALKNIWRNKLRSLVIIFAIAIGLLMGTFASSFVQGMMSQKIESVIAHEISHFQFHHPDFRNELDVKKLIQNGAEIRNKLAADPVVVGSTGRLISTVMIASANQSGAIKALGIVPSDENKVTDLSGKIVEGQFFSGIRRNPVLVSSRTAEKYKLKVRSKVVLTFQDLEGEMVAAAFRVAGIFDTKNGMFDETTLYVRQDDLEQLIKTASGFYHEIAVKLSENDGAESTAQKYQDQYPDLEVKSWLDLGLGMRNMIEAQDSYTSIVVGIILVALLLIILNTMLMAVLERTREIGMLMAIGMTKGKVFQLILFETIFMALIGGAIGLLLAFGLIEHFGSVGIALNGAAYEEVGMSNTVFPTLKSWDYIQITFMVVVMSVIAAIFPAFKALSLKPVEAIRS